MDNKKYPLLLMLGHLACDINPGVIPALLPFLITEYDLTYFAASALVLANSCVSSVVQPFFGHMADRASSPALMGTGILLAGMGISCVGLLENYWLIFIAVMISGVGVALFHPEGGRMVSCVSGPKKGESMGLFSLGGSIGVAAGPLLAAATLPITGVRGTVIFAVPCLIAAFVLFRHNREMVEISRRERNLRQSANLPLLRDDWKGFFVVMIVMFVRSVVVTGILTFLPLFWVDVLRQSQASGSAKLAIISSLGAVSTYFGGKMADRFGFKRTILLGNVIFFPFLFALAFSQSMAAATLLLIPLGLVLNLSHSPSISMGQQFVPNHVGMASGITLGLTVSIGGIASPALGLFGDRHGLRPVILILACACALAAAISAVMPKKTPGMKAS
jgi:FSR family fosmidomycin resistance protein-like MFS transporter